MEKALAFMHSLLCDARKLTHVAHLRPDPLLPELLGIRRVASQSVLSMNLRSSGGFGHEDEAMFTGQLLQQPLVGVRHARFTLFDSLLHVVHPVTIKRQKSAASLRASARETLI